MIRKTVMLTMFIMLSAIFSFAQNADDILGRYHLPNKLDVEIYKKGNKYFGKVIALNGWQDGRTKDYKNPDKSKRNDNLVGKEIIKGLEFDSEKKQWLNGTMYGAEKGMEFNLKVTEIREKEIVVVGSKLIMWKTLVWERLM